MRLVYFGSGGFGLPTLESLAKAHEIALVVTQPDRPAGRHRELTPTPIGQFSARGQLPTIKPERVNAPETIDRIRSIQADAWVVIAFGQKLGRELLKDVFAMNLHGSLLPKYRGAAPINWAIINGERETGVSVIALADRMDAGEIYAMAATAIDPMETAGELHDRLALLGPAAIGEVLAKHASGAVIGQAQDERLATHAPKLSKADGTVRFDQTAQAVRNRIHGLTPWPGCTITIAGQELKLLRVRAIANNLAGNRAGEVQADFSIACASGAIMPLEVQPPGKSPMNWQSYRNGRSIAPGQMVEPKALQSSS